MSSKTDSSSTAVSDTMQQGFANIALSTSVGLLVGGLAGVVLARGGGASRKIMTGLGGGVGLGSAWTRCSMDLEDLVSNKK